MEWTLSDFYNMEVIRTGKLAEIIVDYYQGTPVRLIGFNSFSNNDIEVREEGYIYCKKLYEAIKNPSK